MREQKPRENAASTVRRMASAAMPTPYGAFDLHVYDGETTRENVALVVGPVGEKGPVMVRLHSECFTGDVLGSQRCDCGEQLDAALRRVQEFGCGAVLYLRQEGRGIGLTNKIHAYALQERGLDTVDANRALGLPVDSRDYREAADILRDLGITEVVVLTNNPTKIDGLARYGIRVVGREAIHVEPNHVNHGYLQTKQQRMGHWRPAVVMAEPPLHDATPPREVPPSDPT